MLPNLKLTFLAIALRGEALFRDARDVRPDIDPDGMQPQDARDLEAFRHAGWSFHRERDVNWTDLRLEDRGRIAVEAGLLARRGNRPGLVIIRNSLVVAFASRGDAERVKSRYAAIRELPFGENIYGVDLGPPEYNLVEFMENEISALENQLTVKWVEPVVTYHVEEPVTTPGRRPPRKTLKSASLKGASSPDYEQWHWKLIELRAAWKAAGAKGDGTLVAVIDKGFYEDAEFQLKIDVRAHLDEKGNDIIARTPIPEAAHGTMCAGLVAAEADDGSVHGAAPKCRLMLVALGDTIDSTGMAAALKLCADQGADVVTCSVGPTKGSWDSLKTLLAAIDDVHKCGRNGLGTLVVWAVANADQEIAPNTLESYAPLICVAPTDELDARAPESEYGKGLDLLAPGVAVWVLWWDDQYGPNVIEQSGASVAAPCVAGVAAVVLSYKKKLTLCDLIDVIAEKSCDPVNPKKMWDPKLGWGRLNALRAVQEAGRIP